MGRLKIVLNLVILAVAAFIAWHEYHQPPASKPDSAPKPAPPPKASPPKAPPAAAPEPRAARPEREAAAATKSAPAPPPKPPASADPPPPDSGAAATPPAAAADAGDAEGEDDAEERAAARISELADNPPVPENAVAGDGSHECPEAFPIKGNASSRIYHEPGRPSYDRTIAEFCFATAEAAEAAGFRAPRH